MNVSGVIFAPLEPKKQRSKKKKKNAWSQVRIALALGLPLPSAGMRGKENMLTIFFQNIILFLEYQLIECLCSEEKFWVEIGQKKFVWNGVGDSRDMAAHPQPNVSKVSYQDYKEYGHWNQKLKFF